MRILLSIAYCRGIILPLLQTSRGRQGESAIILYHSIPFHLIAHVRGEISQPSRDGFSSYSFERESKEISMKKEATIVNLNWK